MWAPEEIELAMTLDKLEPRIRARHAWKKVHDRMAEMLGCSVNDYEYARPQNRRRRYSVTRISTNYVEVKIIYSMLSDKWVSVSNGHTHWILWETFASYYKPFNPTTTEEPTKMEILDEDREAYPVQGQTENMVVTAVLTSGATGRDYAAYAGIGDPEWVAHSGMKLRYRHALRFFPYLKLEEYRT